MRVGIVGCGAVSSSHLDALARMPNVDVVAVCDTDEERAAAAARRFGIERSYPGPADLLDRERPDAVHVLTPPQSHKQVSIQAMEAGAHVLVEKPMALDADEAGEMLEASRRHARTLSVCHNYLFHRGVAKARTLMAEGRLGRVVAVEIFLRPYRGPGHNLSPPTPWLRTLPGGLVHEVLPHFVYLLEAFLGRVTVAGALERTLSGLPEPALEFRALFEGESGLGSTCVSYSAHPYQYSLRIYGTDQTVHVDLLGELAVSADRDEYRRGPRRLPVNVALGSRLIAGAVGAAAAAFRGPLHPAHAALIERFYDGLRRGAAPPVSGEDGKAVVEVLDSVWAVLQRPPLEPAAPLPAAGDGS
jgi:predicted dehydrogenase